MSQIPILFLGDSASLQTGLARIGRDLAVAVARLPQYRVAYLGRGLGAHTGQGIADSRLPFMQYTYQPTSDDQWGSKVLPDVWQNWAGDERGVIFTVWDVSRLTWFGNPQPGLADTHPELYRFLTSDRFERWGYFAVDAHGPGVDGALVPMLADTLYNYNRVLAYSKFGKRVIDASLKQANYETSLMVLNDDMALPEADWLPHGINLDVFKPRDRAEARARFKLPQGIALIGCVMANQPRKDWGLWAQTAKLVSDRVPNAVFWAHTDDLTRHWDLRVLLEAFGLETRVVITIDQASDVEMSWRYSACDLTMLPSLGEGFGYPIVESLACDVPCITGGYGAGSEWIEPTGLPVVNPSRDQMDGRWCMMRPVYDAHHWAASVNAVLLAEPLRGRSLRESVGHLDWRQLWPRRWAKWWVEGAERFQEAR